MESQHMTKKLSQVSEEWMDFLINGIGKLDSHLKKDKNLYNTPNTNTKQLTDLNIFLKGYKDTRKEWMDFILK